MVENHGEPLVVDWRDEQRRELEIAMKQGLAIVAYDCHALRLLKSCSIDGTYGFMGTTRKEQLVRLENGDEMKANLPLSGDALVAKLGSAIASGTTLDVALVSVGRRRSTWRNATHADLRGDCDGATHFVRGATVGAFTMQTGARGRVSTVAELFGGRASATDTGTESVRNVGGTLGACATATVDALAPPGQCDAPVRLELTAVGAASARDDVALSDIEACPSGMVRSAGKCTTNATVHQCRYGDVPDCTKQCDAGDGLSCFNLGQIFDQGRHVAPSRPRAAQLWKKGCDLDWADACANSAASLERGAGVPADHSAALASYDRACRLGSARGCTNLGALLAHEPHPDLARIAVLNRQGCDGGDAFGCTNLGAMQLYGQSLPRDAALALATFKRGCDGGDKLGCVNIAVAYIEGDPPVRDAQRGRALLQKQCNGGTADACHVLQQLNDRK